MIALAVARTTFLENIRQPVYLVLTVLGVALILVSPVVTLFTLHNTTITVIETAFTCVLVVGMLISIFSASSLIYHEFESKTLMTVLSKPVGRGQIIFGKFLGISMAIFLSCALLTGAIALTAWLSARSNEDILIDAPLLMNMAKIAALTFCQLLILVAVTILFATTMPITLTAVFTLLVFFLGHLQDAYLHFAEGNAIAAGFGQVYKFLIPNLEFYNLSQQLYSQTAIDGSYVLWNAAYAAVYTGAYLLLAIQLFNRKDFS